MDSEEQRILMVLRWMSGDLEGFHEFSSRELSMM